MSVPIWALFTKYDRKSGAFKALVALETKDNLIDFNEIRHENLGTTEFSYHLYQQNDVQSRTVKGDSITKFCYKIDINNVFYGLSLRESNYFDIYWDMFLVH